MAGDDEDKKDVTEEAIEASEEAEKEDANKKDDEAPPTTVVSAETLNNVAERLKFFFSDANIRGDRFMQNQINVRQAHGKRPVAIEVLLRFNTLKKYTTDADVVIQATKQLLADQLVVVNDEKPPALQRVHSFTMEMMNDNVPKSLVVSNLPIQKKTPNEKDENEDEEATYAVSMDDIRKVFEEFGPVAMIRMRFGPSPKQQQQQQQAKKEHEEEHEKRVQYRYPAQYAFVEYEALADCEKALAEILTAKQGNEVEPKRKLQLGGNDLKVISLQDYMDEQKMKRQAKKHDKAAPEEQPADGGSSSENKSNNNNKTESYTVDWKPGCVIKLEGLGDGCDREAIMQAVANAMDYSTVEALKAEQLVYVDYSRGQATGAIRFFEPNDKIKTLLSKLCPTTTTATASTDDADKQENKAEGGGDEDDKAAKDNDVIQIAGAKVEKAYLLEGEQEEKYWKEFIDFKNHQKRRQAESDNHRHNNNSNKRGGGGGKHQHHRNPKRQKRR